MQSDELNPRLRMIVDLLPKHSWKVKPAAIEAGYSESYADRLSAILKRNIRFCKAVAAKQAEMGATEADKIARLVQSWENIAHDDNVSMRDRLKAGELLGKYHAIFSERRVLEVPERQRQLEASEQHLAQRLAGMMHQTASLPGEAPIMPFLTPSRPRIIDAEFTAGESEGADGPEAERDDGDREDGPDKDM